MGKIGKYNIVEIRLVLMAIAAIATFLDAAVAFEFLTNFYLKLVAFFILMLSIFATLVIDVREKLAERENEAKEIITKALDIASLTLSRGRKDVIRASVFMHNKQPSDKLEIRFHSSNMEKAADLHIKFEKWQGCVGKAWGYETGVVAIAGQLIPETRENWNLTEEQYALTQELRTIIAQPVTNPEVKGQVIGILCFDTTSDLSKFFTSKKANVLVADLSGFIGNLLVTYNIKRPLSQ